MNFPYYFPLSLLERIFSNASGVYHLFNYRRIVQYTDSEQLSKKKYVEHGKTFESSNAEMREYISSTFNNIMPDYLIKDRYASFLFIMEYQYGLKSTRNISSMISYLTNQSFFNDFLSTDVVKRTEAYYKTVALLDDGHTSIRDGIDFPWYQQVNVNPTGEHVKNIVAIRQRLQSQRTLTPGEVHYYNDE